MVEVVSLNPDPRDKLILRSTERTRVRTLTFSWSSWSDIQNYEKKWVRGCSGDGQVVCGPSPTFYFCDLSSNPIEWSIEFFSKIVVENNENRKNDYFKSLRKRGQEPRSFGNRRILMIEVWIPARDYRSIIFAHVLAAKLNAKMIGKFENKAKRKPGMVHFVKKDQKKAFFSYPSC